MRYTKWLGTLCAIGLLCLQTGLAQAAPENGAWWNPNQMGSGFGIEIQGNTLLMVGFLYEDDGRATWYASMGPMQNATTYQGRLLAFSNGQTLTGAYQAPAAPTDAGAVTLQFTDDSHGTLTRPGGTILPIERARYGSGTASFQPKPGVWWNTAEFGRGFFIEVQGDQILVAGAMYDTNGKPVWYVSVGAMASPTTYQGDWSQYANGQTLTGPYQPPSAPTNVGTFSLEFPAPDQATLTLFAGGAAASRVADLGSPTVIPLEPALPEVPLPEYEIWAGMFTQSSKIRPPGSIVKTDWLFQGTIMWIEDELSALGGRTNYTILVGDVTVTSETNSDTGPGTVRTVCHGKATREVKLRPGDGRLNLRKDGTYTGEVSLLKIIVPYQSTCTFTSPDGSTTTSAELTSLPDLSFEFEGFVLGFNQMKGEVDLTLVSWFEKLASWDFQGCALCRR